MNEEKAKMFRNRLTKVYRHLGKQARRQKVTCFRVYDHDLPEFPFCIEIYEDKLYVAEYNRRHGMNDVQHQEWLDECIEIITSVTSISGELVFLKLRKRKPGRLGQYQKQNELKNEFEVNEQGLKFLVNLGDYLDTGLFLDHRVTRQIVRDESRDKKVMNLFAYTGTFSVYAAAGGAKEVVTVDLSKTYLDWAQRNFLLNGLAIEEEPGKPVYRFIHADVLQYMKTIEPGSFDLIILDPPTFSNSKRMDDILDIQRDHVSLVNDCIRALTPGGVIYFSTNFTRFVLDKEKINKAEILDYTKRTTPFDFEARSARYCYFIRTYQ